jgi:hypothetical protein
MKKQKSSPKKFNFAIGFYWEGGEGSVGCYMWHGSEVKFGTMKEAKSYLKEAKEKYNPAENTDTNFHDYKIFQLVEVPE